VICTDALGEIGVLGEGEAMSAPQGALALRTAQRLLDGWAADRLTLSRQLRTTFPLTSVSNVITLGPTPSDVVMVAPMFLNDAMFIVPGTSPAVESPIAILNDAQYAAKQPKAMSMALPSWVYYQVDLLGGVGTLTFPPAQQSVTIAIYTPEAVGVPASLNTVLTGPSGYAAAFHYQLALWLCGPFGVNVAEQCPLLPQLVKDVTKTMKQPNVQPGILGVDPAVTAFTRGGGYNVSTDNH
jgi:hypothetical protein